MSGSSGRRQTVAKIDRKVLALSTGWGDEVGPIYSGGSLGRGSSRRISSATNLTPLRFGPFWVAVLVAVRCRFQCIFVHSYATGPKAVSTHYKRLIRVNAEVCYAIQDAKNLTQNPRTSESWGFNSPSRHHLTYFIYYTLQGGEAPKSRPIRYKYGTLRI